MKSFPLPTLLLSLATLLASLPAAAAEFRSVGAYPAIMYDAPHPRARKLFIAPAGMPLEVVQVRGDWARVRDVTGDFAWVDARGLVARRTVVARTNAVRVRAAADDNASVAFGVERGVMLDVLDGAPAGWVRVRHRDGASGFVRATDVWGG